VRVQGRVGGCTHVRCVAQRMLASGG
jgi:hypothetical protein